MATIHSDDGIKRITGALSKRKEQGTNRLSVTRVKHFRDPITHEIVKTGPNEIYLQSRRNFKTHPLTEKEKQQRAKWREACKMAKTILADKNHPRYMELYSLWRAQLSSPNPRKQFPNFVRAFLVHEPAVSVSLDNPQGTTIAAKPP